MANSIDNQTTTRLTGHTPRKANIDELQTAWRTFTLPSIQRDPTTRKAAYDALCAIFDAAAEEIEIHGVGGVAQ